MTPEPCQTAGDDEAVDGGIRIDQRREVEARPAEAVQGLLNAEIRVEHPLPDEAGDDERHGEGIEKDRAQQVFLADALVHEHGEEVAEDHAEDDGQYAEDPDVLDRSQPAVARPEAAILVEADEIVAGEEPGRGERPVDREGNADHVDSDRDEDHRYGADDRLNG